MKIEHAFEQRLLPMPGGRSGLRASFAVKVSVPADHPTLTHQHHSSRLMQADTPTVPLSHPEPILDFVASDETLDRCGEIIQASGWDLAAYRQNPVFLNCHQYSDIGFTLGRAEITEIREGRLYQRIRFAVDANPAARIAYELYRGGFLNAVSVGFAPSEWLDGDAARPARRRYIRQELLEVSAVAIPANPNALALALNEGAIEDDQVRELARLIGDCQAGIARWHLGHLKTNFRRQAKFHQ